MAVTTFVLISFLATWLFYSSTYLLSTLPLVFSADPRIFPTTFPHFFSVPSMLGFSVTREPFLPLYSTFLMKHLWCQATCLFPSSPEHNQILDLFVQPDLTLSLDMLPWSHQPQDINFSTNLTRPMGFTDSFPSHSPTKNSATSLPY